MAPTGSLFRSRVRCNRTLKHLFFTSGVHYWEIDVAHTGKRPSLVVGAVPFEGFDSETLNGPHSAWIGGAVGYAAYGAIIQNGVEIASDVTPYHEGDVVGVLLDLNARTIAFFLNGRPVVRTQPEKSIPMPHDNTTPTHILQPIPFTPRAMFAAITVAPDNDVVDVHTAPLPRPWSWGVEVGRSPMGHNILK